jgi:tetratricopeptide (TPR) repeat protein
MADIATHTLQYGVTLHQAGEFAEAERQYRRVLSDCSSHPAAGDDHRALVAQASYNLGVLTMQVGQPALGIGHLKLALDSNPRRLEFWVSYVQALLSMGRASEATSVLEQAKQAGLSDQQLEQLVALAARRTLAISTFASDIMGMLSPYVAGSAGSHEGRAELALVGANRVLVLLAQLAAGDQCAVGSDVQLLDSLCTDASSRSAVSRLADLFGQYGSDKATVHNYNELYGHILRHPETIASVFEIGIGTNNEDVVSNMSRSGRPGASLRAFRDFLPHARVYGADVDKRILFTESRIETYFVDQTDPITFDALAGNLPGELDLIIDDGLHSPDANLTSLIFALKRIRRGGWFVVEDILVSALPVWRVVSALLPSNYASRILKGRISYVFAVQRLHEGSETSLQ